MCCVSPSPVVLRRCVRRLLLLLILIILLLLLLLLLLLRRLILVLVLVLLLLLLLHAREMCTRSFDVVQSFTKVVWSRLDTKTIPTRRQKRRVVVKVLARACCHARVHSRRTVCCIRGLLATYIKMSFHCAKGRTKTKERDTNSSKRLL